MSFASGPHCLIYPQPRVSPAGTRPLLLLPGPGHTLYREWAITPDQTSQIPGSTPGAALILPAPPPLLSHLSSGVEWAWSHDGYAVPKLQFEETQETQVLSKVPRETRDIYVSTLLITQTFNTM